MRRKQHNMSLGDSKSSPFQRHRNILYLIMQYLDDFGLKQSKSMLLTEANLPSDHRVCDNIDLDTIYLDYCSFYQLKFGKTPKFVRRIEETNDVPVAPKANSNKKKNKTDKVMAAKSKESAENVIHEDLALNGSGFGQNQIQEENEDFIDIPSIDLKFQRHTDLISQFLGEMRELACIIERDIVQTDFKVSWDDVLGNESVKQILTESVILPLTYPHLFTNLTKPWKGILLHGVSGVGKSLFAKALSSQTFSAVTFFNISASTLISKWRGESEKFLKVLFTMAKSCAPSIIFIDEFESLASRRDSPKDHEATKRFKNEFLIQIDELDATDGNVLLLANSNLPWDIDVAFLRRFERKILVDLPDDRSRANIIKHFLPNTSTWPENCWNELISISLNLTGSDLKMACKEASMQQIRLLIQSKAPSTEVPVPVIKFEELKFALQQIKPIMLDSAEKHRKWNEKNGNSLS